MTLEILSLSAVYLYGMILTATFLRLTSSPKNFIVAVLQVLITVGLQCYIGNAFGYELVDQLYPLLVHLPMVLMCVFFFHQAPAASIAAVLAAYLLTIPRNMLGVWVAMVWNNPNAKELVKIIITVPLLLVFGYFLAAPMQKVLRLPAHELRLFLVPAVGYYGIIYLTTVYTKLAYSGNEAVMCLIITLLSFVNFAYVHKNYQQLEIANKMERQQKTLTMQAAETALRLEEIHNSQTETRAIRHDLRHYLQMIDDYAAEGRTDKIQQYIHRIQAEIEETVVQQFCLNDSVNLILSSYARKAKQQGIQLDIEANLPQQLDARELDTCVVLANGLENAVHAAQGLDAPQIHVQCSMYADKIVIQIKNPYSGEVRFQGAMPQSTHQGHGLGTYSIRAICRKHGGVSSFQTADGVFTLRAVL